MDISSTSYYPLVLSSYFIAMPIFVDADLSNQQTKKENTHKSKSQASDESQVANYYSVL